MEKSMPDPFLTVPEIAEELRYDPQTVRSWIRQGKLPAIRASNREYRVRRSDLDAMITTMHANGGTPSGARGSATPRARVTLQEKTRLMDTQVRLPDER